MWDLFLNIYENLITPRLWKNGFVVLIISRESSVTSKKLPNVYKSCRKMISIEKLKILTPFQKLPKKVGDLGKLIVAKGFEKLPKVQ